MSFSVGTVAADTDREGSARELGRLLRCDAFVPVRGRRPPPLELPWSALMAWGFKNGMGGLLIFGDCGRPDGIGVRLPEM